MSANLYRFRKVAVESNTLLKGENSWDDLGEVHEQPTQASGGPSVSAERIAICLLPDIFVAEESCVQKEAAMEPGKICDLERLRERTGVFADRKAAGKVLAELVTSLDLQAPFVLAIPAGGVPVAAVLAEILNCPLDVAVVSKITLPWNSEAGYGAVAFDGSYQLNDKLVRSAGLSPQLVEQGIAATRTKVANRVNSLRGKHPLPALAGHDLVVVDDGLASGFTMLVAVDALQQSGARSITVAVPTGHLAAVQRIAAGGASVCCANLRSGYPFAVAAAYRHWSDVSEAEALLVLVESPHAIQR